MNSPDRREYIRFSSLCQVFFWKVSDFSRNLAAGDFGGNFGDYCFRDVGIPSLFMR
jgi:hypothetical protein